jgi:hypothetical protein
VKTSLTFEQQAARWKAMFANRVVCPEFWTAPTQAEVVVSRARLAEIEAELAAISRRRKA